MALACRARATRLRFEELRCVAGCVWGGAVRAILVPSLFHAACVVGAPECVSVFILASTTASSSGHAEGQRGVERYAASVVMFCRGGGGGRVGRAHLLFCLL